MSACFETSLVTFFYTVDIKSLTPAPQERDVIYGRPFLL